jgi:hypothetical protein
MLAYKDPFCSRYKNGCENHNCPHAMAEDVTIAIVEWGGLNAPVAYFDLSNENCEVIYYE